MRYSSNQVEIIISRKSRGYQRGRVDRCSEMPMGGFQKMILKKVHRQEVPNIDLSGPENHAE